MSHSFQLLMLHLVAVTNAHQAPQQVPAPCVQILFTDSIVRYCQGMGLQLCAL